MGNDGIWNAPSSMRVAYICCVVNKMLRSNWRIEKNEWFFQYEDFIGNFEFSVAKLIASLVISSWFYDLWYMQWWKTTRRSAW